MVEHSIPNISYLLTQIMYVFDAFLYRFLHNVENTMVFTSLHQNRISEMSFFFFTVASAACHCSAHTILLSDEVPLRGRSRGRPEKIGPFGLTRRRAKPSLSGQTATREIAE